MDQDWLESRIAAENYLPDDGFTARVVGRLPKTRRPLISLRVAVLGCAGLVAFWLFLLQLPAVLQAAGHSLGTRYSVGINLGRLTADLQQPFVLAGCAGFMVLVALAAIPFLRRWV